MKRLYCLACSLLFVFIGFAQERIISMPDLPYKSMNIAEMDKGFWCSIEFNGGATLMEGYNNLGLINIEYTNGYRFNEWLKIGAGLGVTYYINSQNVRNTTNHLSMPLFIHARGNVLTESIRRTVPYWSLSIGTSLPDGFIFAPTVGIRVGEPRSAFLVGLSYSLRQLKTAPGCIEYFSGALLKLGYEF